jgi:hypothetical protein
MKLLNLDAGLLPQPASSSPDNGDTFLAVAEAVFLEESTLRIYGFHLILSPGLRNGPMGKERSSLRTHGDSIAPGDHLHIHAQKASSTHRASVPCSAAFFKCCGLQVLCLVQVVFVQDWPLQLKRFR